MPSANRMACQKAINTHAFREECSWPNCIHSRTVLLFGLTLVTFLCGRAMPLLLELLLQCHFVSQALPVCLRVECGSCANLQSCNERTAILAECKCLHYRLNDSPRAHCVCPALVWPFGAFKGLLLLDTLLRSFLHHA